VWKTAANYSGTLYSGQFASKPTWFPLLRLVCYVKWRPYADDVYAYNSLYHFVLTTAPRYEVSDDHDSVIASYSPVKDRYGISYISRRQGSDSGYVCAPEQVFSLIDSLVLRMFVLHRIPTADAPAIREEVEPIFRVGDAVEVIINERNRTPRQGLIAHVMRHLKHKRFFYYLESAGKPIKKRYYAEDLRRAEQSDQPERAQPS
jgi:hypothetical protein